MAGMDTTMPPADRSGKELELGTKSREQQIGFLGNADLSCRASTSTNTGVRESGEQNVCFGSFRPSEL